MPKWLKIVLGILVGLIVICGVGVGGAAYWAKGAVGDLKELGEKTKADADAFAKSSDSNGCLAEALRRMEAEPGLKAEITHQVFLEFCLKSAAKAPGFCDGAPKAGEITATATWSVSKCEAAGKAKVEACPRAMQAVAKYCAGQ